MNLLLEKVNITEHIYIYFTFLRQLSHRDFDFSSQYLSWQTFLSDLNYLTHFLHTETSKLHHTIYNKQQQKDKWDGMRWIIEQMEGVTYNISSMFIFG